MKQKNQVTITGFVSSEPVTRTFDSGSSIGELEIKNVMPFGEKAIPSWWKLKGWNAMGEQLAQFNVGDSIEAVGQLRHRTWEGDDGIKRRVTEIVVSKVRAVQLDTEERPF